MKRLIGSLLRLSVVGVLFFVVGVGIAVGVGYFSTQSIARLERLQPQSVVALTDASPGREVLLEGRISAGTPTKFRDYVAYVRERDTDTRSGKEDWDVVERVTPPLTLDLADGQAHIANNSYDFGVNHGGVIIDREKYTGFKAGEQVVVLGVLSSNDDGVQITADTLAQGTRESYIKSVQLFRIGFIAFGSIFALVGMVMIGVDLRTIFRGNRNVPQPRRVAVRRR